MQGINIALECDFFAISSNDLDPVGVVNGLLWSSMEVHPKESGFQSSISMNFSEKRAITKGKLLWNPHGWFLILHQNEILAPGFANLFQIFMFGIKMIAKADERYILGIAVTKGTVDVAVDTVDFMDFQILQQNDDLTSIVGKLAFGWEHLQHIGNKWRQCWREVNLAGCTTFDLLYYQTPVTCSIMGARIMLAVLLW
jgi:hypothetical protein